MVISQEPIKETPVETKAKLATDIMRLLQVREHNEEMAKDWLLFFTTTPRYNQLRPGEIYQAHKMAMSRELYDADEKQFNLIPDLSINTSAKILEAYIKYKKNNPELAKATEELLKLNAPSGPSPEEIEKTREEFLKMIFEDVKSGKIPEEAWLLYDDVKDKLTFTEEQRENIYRNQEHLYIQELKREKAANPRNRSVLESLENALRIKESKKYNGVVGKRCKSIVVCDYLKNHVKDYETFKSAINEI